MYKIHHQKNAERDLKDIWLYTYENFGIDQADRYFDQLEAAMKIIQDNPRIGVSCGYIRDGYRQFKVNEHAIFYKVTHQTISVVRVLHESMLAVHHL